MAPRPGLGGRQRSSSSHGEAPSGDKVPMTLEEAALLELSPVKRQLSEGSVRTPGQLVTAHILLVVDFRQPERWEIWRRGIRNAARNFKGYRGIRYIDLGPMKNGEGQGEGREKAAAGDEAAGDLHRAVVIIKFDGYRCMRTWIDSPERRHWIEVATEVGLIPNAEESPLHLVQQDGVVLDLAGSSPTTPANGGSGGRIQTPPKWRLFLVVWSGVYPLTLLNEHAETLPKIAEATGGDATFATFVYLAYLVPVVTFVIVPLLLRLGLAKFLRVKFPETAVSRALYRIKPIRVVGCVLKEGFGLFRPPKDEPDKRLVDRIETMEGKLEALKGSTNRLRRRLRAVKGVILKKEGKTTESVCNDFEQLTQSSPKMKELLRNASSRMRAESAEVEDADLDHHLRWRRGDNDDIEAILEDDGHEDEYEDAEDSVEGVTAIAHHHVRWDRTEEFEEEMQRFALAMGRFAGDGFMGLDVLTDSSSGKLEYISIFRFQSYDIMRRWMRSEERKHELRRLHPLLEATRGRTTYNLLAVDPFAGLEVEEATLRLTDGEDAKASDAAADGDVETGRLPRNSCADRCAQRDWCGSMWLRFLQGVSCGFKKEAAAGHDHTGEEIGLMLRDVFGDTLTLSQDNHRVLPPPLWKTTFLTWLALSTIVSITAPRLVPVMVNDGITSSELRSLILTLVNVFANTFIGAPCATFLFGNWLTSKNAAEAARGQDVFTKALNLGLPNAFWMAGFLAVYVPVLIFAS